jgi:hypothetical protein
MRNSTFRSCQNFIPDWFDIPSNRRRYEEGFVQMIEERVSEGWRPHGITFQFRQLLGRQRAVLWQMRSQIEFVHAKLVPHVQRFPRSRVGSKNVPILFCSAEFPVRKGDKTDLAEVAVNEGLHHQGILLLPPNSRIRDAKLHFDKKSEEYLGGTQLSSIYLEPITRDLNKAAKYGLKGLKIRRLDYDDSFIVLPRSLSELKDSVCPQANGIKC